jgi:hypothetical protein
MFQFRSLVCATLFAALFLTGNSFAQDQTRFVLKLDNKLVGSLRSYGSLRSQVPEKYRNKISFIELQYDETNEEEPIELGLPISVSGENASLTLDEDLIGQVKGQPVRIPVKESGSDFSQIVLKYEAPVTPSPMLAGSETDTFFIRMTDAQVMAGNMDGFDSFSIKCKFGDINIPMDQIAGIRFKIDNKDSAVVVLTNGDTITGEPTVPAVELKTDWGQADIEPDFIQSLTTSANSRFLQETGDFGVRWRLQTGNSVAPGAAPGQ